jgi:hypothetical protein
MRFAMLEGQRRYPATLPVTVRDAGARVLNKILRFHLQMTKRGETFHRV